MVLKPPEGLGLGFRPSVWEDRTYSVLSFQQFLQILVWNPAAFQLFFACPVGRSVRLRTSFDGFRKIGRAFRNAPSFKIRILVDATDGPNQGSQAS